ncbi:hypothetical protein AVEN_173546-1 [Araneus ventricosus]|uniref:Uncharacterized protein n=1 Tax=Araneus ventricosus TaxID=182803 RepID=A0A4Y2Q1E6_ARAVE|nr:hypothetical protein AVEN_173546-1 [Araneus ventricosus]
MLSNGLSFRELRRRFALLPAVGTRRIDVDCGLVSASVVSRVVTINSSRIKEARRRHCIRSLERSRDICKSTRLRNGTSVRISQSKNANLERLESWSRHTPLEQVFSVLRQTTDTYGYE